MNGIQVGWAVMRHQLAIARAQHMSTLIVVAVPINFLILFILFALSGGHAPVSVVNDSSSPAGSAMDSALGKASTFTVSLEPNRAAAQRRIAGGDSVATIVIPVGFGAGGGSELQVTIDNLNADFADDIRRGLPLAVLRYDQGHQAGRLPVTLQESDQYPQTVSFLGYIAVSVEAVALLLGGLMQGGLAMAREWESGTIQELLLPAAPAWAVITGKLAGSMVLALGSGVCVLLILLGLGVHPRAWGELILVMVALTLVFVALGLSVGSWLRSTRAVIPLAFALGLPLFFISGPFGPISWGTAVSAGIARVFPVVYANATIQHATFGYLPLDAGWPTIVGVLAVWTVAGLVLSVGVHRRATRG